ncbi:hypothetical protein Sjap_016108 [Stephania japonica]|uniref:Dof zinc finger protein n=1 Tax=Stephania japonica TaxID=461633 RepID=A0AAP0NUM7_9MAGN
MGLTDLQVCMDTSDWLQGSSTPGGVNDLEMGMDSSASSGDIMTCTSRQPTMLERRLRPQHDQGLIKCPRCDSTHTKFCYYNNYSLSQPRYFCKTCRRYWTKGGSLRNIPVGGGCRKNTKRSSSSSTTTTSGVKRSSTTTTSTDLHLSTTFPEVLQMPHFCTTLLGDHQNDIGGINFMESKFDGILGSQIDPMRTQTDFMASTDLGIVGGLGGHHGFTFSSTTTNNINIPHHHHSSTMCTPYGISLSGNNYSSSTVENIVDSCQRFVVPFEATHENPNESTIEMKPNKHILSLDWQDQQQGCSEFGKDPFGYFSNLGSWNPNGLTSTGFGSSATNPLV